MSATLGKSTHCANCNKSLENIPKVSKIRCNEEVSNDIPVCDVFADICGISSSQVKEVSSQHSQTVENAKAEMCQLENEVFLCGCCAPLISAYYAVHRNFETATHPSSLIQRLKQLRNGEHDCQTVVVENSYFVPDFSKDSSLLGVVEQGNQEKDVDNLFEDIYFHEDDQISDFGDDIDIKDVPACPESLKRSSWQLLQSNITKEVVIKLKRLSSEELQKVYGIKKGSTANGGTPGESASRKWKVFRRRRKANKTSEDWKGEEKTKHTCPVCGKTFSSSRALCVHKRIHTGVKKFICEICSQSFRTKCSLMIHIRSVHSQERNFVCPTCGMGFKRSHHLKAHMGTHEANNEREIFKRRRRRKSKVISGDAEGENGKENIVCDECGKILSSTGKLLRHKMIHTGEKPFRCEICPRRFFTKAELKTHLVSHSEERNVECENCESKFKSKRHLKSHIKHIHDHDASNGKMVRKRFTCAECGVIYLVKNYYKEHILTHQEGFTPYLCPHCGKSFTAKYLLKAHEKIHSEERKFCCAICPSKFKTGAHLKLHMESIHSKERKYICEMCGNSYKTKIGLGTHIRKQHTAEEGEESGVFSCPDCEKTFNFSSLLEKHRNFVHFRLKDSRPREPYKCNHCDKDFISKSYYDLHMRKHSENYTPSFVCNECGRVCNSQSNLNRHVKMHTGVKEFPCDICSKMFTVMSDVKRHKNTVHNSEYLFSCDRCEKRFKIKAKLHHHIKRYHKNAKESFPP